MTSTEHPATEDRPAPLGLRRDGLDPDPEVTELRERDGVCPVTTLAGHRAELVAGFQDARRVHGDPAFSFEAVPPPPGMSAYVDSEELLRRRAGMLLAIDPPHHTRLRRMLTGRFTVRAMKALEPRVTTIVDDALERMTAGGPPADLVADFALPVPSLVICELLGVPYADRDEFQERAARTLESDLSPRERSQVIDASRAYMGGLVERARRDPGDDLIGMLIREHGDRSADEGGIDDDELAGLANLLLVAGHETTSNVIALGTLAVLTDPDQMAALRAAVDADEPAPLNAAVEEMLRFISPVSAGFPRMATDDVAVGSHDVPSGTLMTASLCAANRDPALGGGDLEHLDLTRAPLPHVAFGYGIHHCLGAPLARIELRIAFTALLRRLPDLALAVDPSDLRYRQDNLIHGVEALPVTW
ncbi:cytochrome P450 [Actinomycetospora endophytica]|uniref:Cytochrome P450 n=1 Tax=Actinomycetospora endophytica TaxID=2291215 RepID=A0ABS8P9U9_9PSEU|nr:cytochrome P450 [Actinomycetospora endophytica]MCD2195003.1 cytochrome P450 [Actinomycetospora endophytica]